MRNWALVASPRCPLRSPSGRTNESGIRAPSRRADRLSPLLRRSPRQPENSRRPSTPESPADSMSSGRVVVSRTCPCCSPGEPASSAAVRSRSSSLDTSSSRRIGPHPARLRDHLDLRRAPGRATTARCWPCEAIAAHRLAAEAQREIVAVRPDGRRAPSLRRASACFASSARNAVGLGGRPSLVAGAQLEARRPDAPERPAAPPESGAPPRRPGPRSSAESVAHHQLLPRHRDRPRASPRFSRTRCRARIACP